LSALLQEEEDQIAIESHALSKTYGHSSQPALSNVSLVIPKSKIFTLLGKNGAGKTTFLRIAATQLAPTSGSIVVLGHDVVKEPKKVRERIAAVPQEARPFQVLTPLDHVMMSLMIRGYSWKAAKLKGLKTLEKLGLSSYRNVASDDLSGGLRQRTLVAMAFATDAEILFLDEPTIGLDPIARRQIWRTILHLKHEGKTIVLTTHYLDEAEAISDLVAIIDRGRLVTVGTVSELKSSIEETVRVDVTSGFTEAELSQLGKITKIGEAFRVLTNDAMASKLTALAIDRKVRVNVSPVSLDDVFIDLVGMEEEEEEEEGSRVGEGKVDDERKHAEEEIQPEQRVFATR
jgi:ABC-2 type transport system ATP-binding protein